jgi:hypothetical protein
MNSTAYQFKECRCHASQLSIHFWLIIDACRLRSAHACTGSDSDRNRADLYRSTHLYRHAPSDSHSDQHSNAFIYTHGYTLGLTFAPAQPYPNRHTHSFSDGHNRHRNRHCPHRLSERLFRTTAWLPDQRKHQQGR